MKYLIFFLFVAHLSSQMVLHRELDDPFFEKNNILKKKSGFYLSNQSLFGNNGKEISYYHEFSPIFRINFSKNISVIYKHNLIKNENFYVPATEKAENFYKYKDFIGFKSYTEEGFLYFEGKFFNLKLGKFIDQIGESPFLNLMMSAHDYHNGYKLTMKYENLEFYSRFFYLSPFFQKTTIHRYFHHHGFQWKIGKNFRISFHETALLAGENLPIRWNYMNPLTVYYAEQVNDNLNSNSNIGINFAYFEAGYKIFSEIYIDDFQIDEGEKEPNQIGLILGGIYINKNYKIWTQVSVIRHRIYNDHSTLTPNLSFTKYIDHDKVMGFPYGSNLVRIDLQYARKLIENFSINYNFSYTLYGKEAVFSVMDTDYQTNKGVESIPYGKLHGNIKNSFRLRYDFTYFKFYGIFQHLKEKDQSNFKIYFGIGHLLKF